MNDTENLIISASPHITKKGNTTRRIMLDVLIALAPALIAATYFYGYLVLVNCAVCVLFCMGFELLYTLIAGGKWNAEAVKKSSAWDLSSAVTGVILALNLPTHIDIWGLSITREVVMNGEIVKATLFSFDTIIACIFASLFAIVIVKMLFGGIGRNFANPAASARVLLSICFALTITNKTIGWGLNASTGATWLGDTTQAPNLLDMFLGKTGTAAVGETCVIALLLGYIYLSIRKVIDFRMPLIIVVSAGVFALLFDGLLKQHLSGTALLYNMLGHMLSGGLIFGAIFMATDYATTPNTFWGNVIFGVGLALLSVCIRVYSPMPEGVSFAIVIMNIFTPVIDKFVKPRPFGYVKPNKSKNNGAVSAEGGKK